MDRVRMTRLLTVVIGDAEVNLEEAFQLCGGRLLCQASSLHPLVLVDFAGDYGIIAPALFLHRLKADALSESAKLFSPAGDPVRLSNKRVIARPRRRRPASATSASAVDGL